MILVDRSAWVEFDRATGSAVDRALTDLIATGGPVAVSELVEEERRRDVGRELDLFEDLLDLRFAQLLVQDRDLANVARAVGVPLYSVT